jgi:hypothetical protein
MAKIPAALPERVEINKPFFAANVIRHEELQV